MRLFLMALALYSVSIGLSYSRSLLPEAFELPTDSMPQVFEYPTASYRGPDTFSMDVGSPPQTITLSPLVVDDNEDCSVPNSFYRVDNLDGLGRYNATIIIVGGQIFMTIEDYVDASQINYLMTESTMQVFGNKERACNRYTIRFQFYLKGLALYDGRNLAGKVELEYQSEPSRESNDNGHLSGVISLGTPPDQLNDYDTTLFQDE
ncbi:hypothetical protein [Endozoicomonas arenosclerae]|uniref:hypothetical protein n=1 Tax=Endozoicomonas arenosclerae TaxID=1633495 RepID=UPI00078049E4|nr:hypothetical protein [Endozoicomonas arenosclerae]